MLRRPPFIDLHPEAELTDSYFSVNGRDYAIARMPYIGPGAGDLYRAEDDSRQPLKQRFTALAAYMEIPKKDFWTQAVPEGLCSVLGDYEPASAIAAAVGFLRREGFEVTIPKPKSTAEQIMDRVLDDETTGE